MIPFPTACCVANLCILNARNSGTAPRIVASGVHVYIAARWGWLRRHPEFSKLDRSKWTRERKEGDTRGRPLYDNDSFDIVLFPSGNGVHPFLL